MSLPSHAVSPGFAQRIATAFAFCLLIFSVAGQASATRMQDWDRGDHDREWGDDDRPSWHHKPNLPGISLARLVEGGGSFSSRNGEVIFGDFQADTLGIAPEKLDLYRVVPIADGFRLLTPLFALFGKNAALDLSYTVDAADGLLIESASISLQSAAIFGKAFASMSLFDGRDLLAELEVGQRGFHHRHGKNGKNKKRDEVVLSEAIAGFSVEELIGLKTGLFAATRSVHHRFGTTVVPEPGTALLMGLGLAGLSIAGRRRSA